MSRRSRASGHPLLKSYRDTFSAVKAGEAVLLDTDFSMVTGSRNGHHCRQLAYPRVAVYTGSGASHSWIWFADLLERQGIYDVRFINESYMIEEGLDEFDLLLVGGGDTYAMAAALGRDGAGAIERHVRGGGLYFGSCAGAYLVLGGVDREPFTPFSLVEGDMMNVMDDPPPPRCLEHKYLAGYGDGWVFHPVYGELEISAARWVSGFPCFMKSSILHAPLFGGPVMGVEDPEEVVAEYSGLTDRAAYPWPRNDAADFVIGRAAVALARNGEGQAVVSGPHLEHPLFPEANALAAEIFLRHCAGIAHRKPETAGGNTEMVQPGTEASLLLEIKRQVSNSRIVGFGLEKMPVTWKIGLKVWEPEKIRMFLDYAWERLPCLERCAGRIGPVEPLEELASGYSRVTGMVKSLKMKIEAGEDSLEEASSLLLTLKELTAGFLSLYFRLRMEG